MSELLQTYFTGPMLVPSGLLALVCLYWLFVILGAFDIELFDFDLDLDVDGGSISDLGLISLRFLNLGDIPLMIWGSVFSLSFWVVTALAVNRMAFDAAANPWVIVPGSALIAVVVTKVLTNPLRGRFTSKPPNPVAELLGKTCVITALTTEKFGQAEYRTEAAPLLLNVRTHEGTLAKGTMVRIVDFDQEHHLYYVSGSDLEG